MRTNNNQFRTALFATTVLVLLAGIVAHADNIYVSSYSGGTIEKFDSSGNMSIFASGLNGPAGLAFDSSGNLYVANYGSGTIDKFDPSGNMSIFASGLYEPLYLAFDTSGNLYVTDFSGLYRIDKFDSSGHRSTFVSGLGAPSIACDNSGNLYSFDRNTFTIIKFDSSGNGSTFASGVFPLNDLAFDSSGTLYSSDQMNCTIDKFDSSGHAYFFAFFRIYPPEGLAFDSSGNLYVSVVAAGNLSTIYKIDPSGNKTIFASVSNGPGLIATQIPEPATLLLLGLGAVRLLRPRSGHVCSRQAMILRKRV